MGLGMERQFTESERLAIDLEVARRCMSRGDLVAMEHLLADVSSMERTNRMGSAEDLELIDLARTWAQNASLYEREHGQDSMLNRDDPYVQTIILGSLARWALAPSRATATS